MREIIFRGKQADSGEWVEGSLVIDTYDRAGKTEKVYRIADYCYGQDEYGISCYQAGLDAEVAPETIGQFTGLVDRHGTKIFEGDICESDNGERSAIWIARIGESYPKEFFDTYERLIGYRFAEPLYGLYGEVVGSGRAILLAQSKCIKVLGNVFDNPDLLEG